MARLELKKCPFCGAEVDTVSVKEKDGNLNIKMKRKDRWISVEDALPEEDVSVLCYMRIGEIVVMEYGGDGWYCGVTRYNPRAVTHWMYLPEPPESEVQRNE